MDETKDIKKKKKKKRRKKNYVLRFFIVICIGIGLYLFLTSSLFDIETVSVENNIYYTPEQIINIAGAKTGGNIFAESTRAMKANLLKDPYIKNAAVARNLPDDIGIVVEERKEAAYILYRSDFVIIDNDGMVLRQASVEPKLTLLEGMTIKKIEPGMPLEVEENGILTGTLNLLKKMEEQGLYFKRIKISNVVIKVYIFDNLVCEATPENLAKNMQQLKEVMTDLYKKGIERGVINMGSDGYFSFSPVPE
jgi:cell division protein FtsQ